MYSSKCAIVNKLSPWCIQNAQLSSVKRAALWNAQTSQLSPKSSFGMFKMRNCRQNRSLQKGNRVRLPLYSSKCATVTKISPWCAQSVQLSSKSKGGPLEPRQSIRRGVKGFFSPIEKAKLIGPLQGKA